MAAGERTCRFCGSTFIPRQANQTRCSALECFEEYQLEWARLRRLKAAPVKACIYCGRTVPLPYAGLRVICGDEVCRRMMRRDQSAAARRRRREQALEPAHAAALWALENGR